MKAEMPNLMWVCFVQQEPSVKTIGIPSGTPGLVRGCAKRIDRENIAIFARKIRFLMKKPLFFTVLCALLLCSTTSYAQEVTDSLNLKVYFRQNVSTLETDYNNNEVLIGRFISDVKRIMADPACRIQDIVIRSGSSPEGSFDHNRELSRRRGRNLRIFLQNALNIPEDKFTVDAVGEDWAALRAIVENSRVPDREDILDILDGHLWYIKSRPQSVVGGPKKELMDLNGGRTWKWLLQNVFPELRSAGNGIVCRYTRTVKPETAAAQPRKANDTLVIIHKYVFDMDTVSMAGFPVKMEAAVPTGINVKDSARTIIGNSLIDATFSPKLEINMSEGKDATIEVDNKVVIPQKK